MSIDINMKYIYATDFKQNQTELEHRVKSNTCLSSAQTEFKTVRLELHHQKLIAFSALDRKSFNS